MNTRRYPRSLAQAFPKDYADPIERPERIHTNVTWFCVAIIVGLVAAVGMGVI